MEDHLDGWNHAVNSQPKQPLMRPMTDDQLRPRYDLSGYRPNEPTQAYPTPQTGGASTRPQPQAQSIAPLQPLQPPISPAVQPTPIQRQPMQPSKSTPQQPLPQSDEQVAPGTSSVRHTRRADRHRDIPAPIETEAPVAAPAPVRTSMPTPAARPVPAAEPMHAPTELQRSAVAYPAYQTPAFAPHAEAVDDADELPPVSELERHPVPVPTSAVATGKARERKHDAIIIVACIVGVLAVLTALYFFGVLDALAVKIGLPPRNPATVVTTADMQSSLTPVEGSSVNPLAIVEASSALKPTLRSVKVEPTEAVAPATLTFTIETNQGASAVRLLLNDATTLSASGSSLLTGDTVTWTLNATVENAYTGDVRVFLRNDDGLWIEGDKTCAIRVGGAS